MNSSPAARLRGACAEVDITPALPCEKPGWIVKILAQRVEDPIFAKVMVLEDAAGTRVAFVSLDVLSVRWPMGDGIRKVFENVSSLDVDGAAAS